MMLSFSCAWASCVFFGEVCVLLPIFYWLFLIVGFWEFLMCYIFWVSHRYMVCKDNFPVCSFSFHFVNSVCGGAGVFNFYEVQFIRLYFHGTCFCCGIREVFAYGSLSLLAPFAGKSIFPIALPLHLCRKSVSICRIISGLCSISLTYLHIFTPLLWLLSVCVYVCV